ncbi:MAG: hypothetical protein ACRDFX_04280 [Chloroflexota bacterium]
MQDLSGAIAAVSDLIGRSVIGTVVAAFESAFPHRIRSYYLHGSRADHTDIVTSDVDLDIVVCGSFRDETEQAAINTLAATLVRDSTTELDLDIIDEESLAAGANPMLKLGSVLAYGEDILPRIPMVSIHAWARERMHAAYYLAIVVFHRPTPVRYPLSLPNETSEFFGYADRPIVLSDGTGPPGTRDLIRVTGWMASALIAHHAGQYVPRKQDCHRLYREHIDDEWSDLIEELYVFCRGEWNYLLPTDQDQRRRLRDLCRRTLDFENHFLGCYKRFLLEELANEAANGESRLSWLMRVIPFEDRDVQTALRSMQ